ncbi:hypothetical protein [Agrobacterium sp. SUL3]|uniref:hypothetical protein n=1 Tax=Agrobacterium sp. SUL3 TaxID=1701910 RepID=UPI000AE97036|nr:hypothetical protein [Agrobacterium sp. SUL3]
MADELKDQRVVTMMSPSELEAIDEWMFRNRLKSRGEAIRRLCHLGMRSEDQMRDLLSAVVKGLEAENAMIQRMKEGKYENLSPMDIFSVGQEFLREIYAIIGSNIMEGMVLRTAATSQEAIQESKDIADRLKALGSTKKQVDTFVDFANRMHRSKKVED